MRFDGSNLCDPTLYQKIDPIHFHHLIKFGESQIHLLSFQTRYEKLCLHVVEMHGVLFKFYIEIDLVSALVVVMRFDCVLIFADTLSRV